MLIVEMTIRWKKKDKRNQDRRAGEMGAKIRRLEAEDLQHWKYINICSISLKFHPSFWEEMFLKSRGVIQVLDRGTEQTMWILGEGNFSNTLWNFETFHFKNPGHNCKFKIRPLKIASDIFSTAKKILNLKWIRSHFASTQRIYLTNYSNSKLFLISAFTLCRIECIII